MHELAPWACHPALTRGRRFPEPSAAPRTEHQRDRDRIVHSTAFRRLVYKTQVFLNHEGDLFRTRLTHSLEVAQLGRSMARMLQLNEDLVEAIALAHDLGHTPFGHAGQDALADCMKGHGGFEHNLQSLRVVDHLEARYAEFDGLNLTLETRQGILKHCARAPAEALERAEPGGPGHRFVAGLRPSLEAQLVNLADEMAYNAHDIDDGVRSGLLAHEALDEVALFARQRREALGRHPSLAAGNPRRLLAETLRRMIAVMVDDLVDTTRGRLQVHRPADSAEACRMPALVAFSDGMRQEIAELKRFLLQRLYRHPQVLEMTDRGKRIVSELFAAYALDPSQMPQDFAQGPDLHRGVADYIAGMTDRFACREHLRLTGSDLFGVAR